MKNKCKKCPLMDMIKDLKESKEKRMRFEMQLEVRKCKSVRRFKRMKIISN